MRKKHLGFILILVVSFMGCAEKKLVPKPDNLLPEEAYVMLVAELQLLDAWVYTNEEVSNPDSIKHALFTNYGTTEEIFENSHAYYQSEPEAHIARIDSVLNLLEAEQKRINQSLEEDSKRM